MAEGEVFRGALIWPLTLIAAYRLRNPVPFISVLALASFVLAQVLLPWHQEWSFYQMPPRLWEFVCGGIIATLPRRPATGFLAFPGLILILIATIFPATPQIPPLAIWAATFGATAICFAVHGGGSLGIAGKILRSKPLVAIGLISYSLYLWHWPLLAFYRATTIGDTSSTIRLLLCATAFPIAYASYRYIEQPLRRIVCNDYLTLSVALTTCTICAISIYFVSFASKKPLANDPFPLATLAEHGAPPENCRYHWDESIVPKCPDPIGADTIIWGDSMAYAWRPAMPTPVIDLSHDTCPPLLDWMPEEKYRIHYICREFESAAVRHIQNKSLLVIAALWRLGGTQSEALRSTLTAVSAKVKRVVIIGPTPELNDSVPRCLRNRAEAQCAISRADFEKKSQPILEKLRRASEGLDNIEVVDMTDYFCTNTECPPVRNGIPLYWDSHHPTTMAVTGALQFAPLAEALHR